MTSLTPSSFASNYSKNKFLKWTNSELKKFTGLRSIVSLIFILLFFVGLVNSSKPCKNNEDCGASAFNLQACINSECKQCSGDNSKTEECDKLISSLMPLAILFWGGALTVLILGITACCCCCVCCPGYKWRNQRKMDRAEARKYQAEDSGRSTFSTYRPGPTPSGTTRPVRDDPPPTFEFPTDDVETGAAKT